MMLIKDLKVGDKLEDYRTGAVIEVTSLEPWSGGNGDVMFTQVGPWRRSRCMTFKQFERLKFIRRLGDRRP